jgi:nucleotide-binding universal stress UspA family protein
MYDRILVPTDGSDCAGRAAEHAFDLATTYGASVEILSVADVRLSFSGAPVHVDTERVLERQRSACREAVTRLAERAESEGIDVETAVRTGNPYEEIVEHARERDVDLVVMGTHGRTGFRRVMLGSVAERVVRSASVPVLTFCSE